MLQGGTEASEGNVSVERGGRVGVAKEGREGWRKGGIRSEEGERRERKDEGGVKRGVRGAGGRHEKSQLGPLEGGHPRGLGQAGEEEGGG